MGGVVGAMSLTAFERGAFIHQPSKRRTVAEYAKALQGSTARYKAHLTSGAVLHIARDRNGSQRIAGALPPIKRRYAPIRAWKKRTLLDISAVFGTKIECARVSTEQKCALSHFSHIRSLRFIRSSAISRLLRRVFKLFTTYLQRLC